MRSYSLMGLSLIILLIGCSGVPALNDPLPPRQTATPEPRLTPVLPIGDIDLDPLQSIQVWLPPEFNPNRNIPQTELLQNRLIEFTENHPGLTIVTRIKKSEGEGNLIETLESAISAAPLALPDLVLLTDTDLAIAASKQLIVPLDNLLPSSEPEKWYPFSIEMGLIGSETFGIPFAVDGLVMLYHPSVIDTPPANWGDLLKLEGPISFPAADPQALFTTLLYLAQKEELVNEDGQLVLDEAKLQAIFDFYQLGQETNLMPFWLTQYQSDALAWLAFRENRAQITITWASRYLSQDLEDVEAAPIPTRNGNIYTLVKGWVWSITSSNPEQQQLAIELAEFLTEDEFLGLWTEAAGFFPTKSNSVPVWPPGPKQILANQILPLAELSPSIEILDTLGPILTEGTIGVLKQEYDSFQATDLVLDQIK